jgi:hypothetical protein
LVEWAVEGAENVGSTYDGKVNDGIIVWIERDNGRGGARKDNFRNALLLR